MRPGLSGRMTARIYNEEIKFWECVLFSICVVRRGVIFDMKMKAHLLSRKMRAFRTLRGDTFCEGVFFGGEVGNGGASFP